MTDDRVTSWFDSKLAFGLACGCTLKRLFPALVLFALGSCLQAQQFPTLTYETPVFNHVTDASALSPIPTPGVPLSSNVCTGTNSKCAIQNTGMGTHLIRYCTGGNNTGLDLWLEGTTDTVAFPATVPATWTQISPEANFPNGISGCGYLKACGYFNYLRLHLQSQAGTANFIDAQYSGIATNCDAAGTVTNNGGAQPATFNPANFAAGFTSVGLTTAKSTATMALAGDNVIYSMDVSNPNTGAVFASLQCNGVSPVTIFQIEVPANDTRPFPVAEIGTFCSFNTLVLCSTSQSSLVDPTNSCLFNASFKPMLSIHSQVTNAGSTTATRSQTPN